MGGFFMVMNPMGRKFSQKIDHSKAPEEELMMPLFLGRSGH